MIEESHLVIDICNVHHEVNIVAKVVAQDATDEILGYIVSTLPARSQAGLVFPRQTLTYLAWPMCEAS